MHSKSNGMSIMISAYAFQELGFGLHFTEEELEKLNGLRADPSYLHSIHHDKTAAIKLLGSANKSEVNKLVTSPFI
eukprot:10397800-Ditylum_brightwellii.AAC.1